MIEHLASHAVLNGNYLLQIGGHRSYDSPFRQIQNRAYARPRDYYVTWHRFPCATMQAMSPGSHREIWGNRVHEPASGMHRWINAATELHDHWQDLVPKKG